MGISLETWLQWHHSMATQVPARLSALIRDVVYVPSQQILADVACRFRCDISFAGRLLIVECPLHNDDIGRMVG